MEQVVFTSITDIPVKGSEEESLDIKEYIEALVDFTKNSDTPLTVGLQGQWGSGKTSLMNLIKEMLIENGNIAYSWVNTWEYSLFKSIEETIPSLLMGLVENLTKNVKEIQENKDSNATLKKAGKIIWDIGKIALGVFSDKARKTVEEVENTVVAQKQDQSVSIASIKNNIQELVNEILEISNKKYKKVIFFIDDLDRIEPSAAVEVLESLKNLFDVKNAVFILAIDYDVVVKGLEKKFGKKTQENEREFRSFFDKIIQVPFSMPVGQYKIENLLVKQFKRIGIEINEQDMEDYAEIVKYTVGYVPRSIKRFLNTYSLLTRISQKQQIKENQEDDDNGLSENDSKLNDFVLFSLIGFQIAYPKVYQLMVKEANFLSWDDNFGKTNGLTNEDLESLKEDKSNQLLDEKWEQILYIYCQKDFYLRTRTFDILRGLNYLRQVSFEKCDEEKTEDDKAKKHSKIGDDKLIEVLGTNLQVSNVTNVTESSEQQQSQSSTEAIIYDFKKNLVEKFGGEGKWEKGKYTFSTYKWVLEDKYKIKIIFNHRDAIFAKIMEVKNYKGKLKDLSKDEIERIFPDFNKEDIEVEDKYLSIKIPFKEVEEIKSEKYQERFFKVIETYKNEILLKYLKCNFI